MLTYTSPVDARVSLTISTPQDVIDDVVVGTVNPMVETTLDTCSALYTSVAMANCQRAYIDGAQNRGTSSIGDIPGYGRSVGVIALDPSGVTIEALRQPGIDDTPITVGVLSVANTTYKWAFAQDEAGRIIVGHGAAPAQKVFRSTDGGLTWSEITLPAGPGLSNAATAVTVFFDRFTGDWYIFRAMSLVTFAIYRSTNNGGTWAQVSYGSALAKPLEHGTSIASEESGRIWAKTGMPATSTVTIYYSDDQGATWSTAPMPAGHYPSALVEWNGVIMSLGSNGTNPFIAKWTGAAWSINAITKIQGAVSFARLAVLVGPLLVGVATGGTGSTSSVNSLVSFRKFEDDYQVIGSVETTVWNVASQALSPGGVHAIANSTNGHILRILNGF